MTLNVGTKLGPYEIVAPLGAGGMGEVYRARDPRIGRDVAIKVLPAAFSKDPERLRRFEQEARSAGVLNHPNILAIFDIGTEDGAPFVVSELLEGETLRERLRSGALPARKAIEIGVQIARGLATAHEHGIVHRDLKPENIFVTRDGRVKLLDFGLAKLTLPERDMRTSAPTVAHDTGPGTVWGTASYMSPEQVRGNPVDHRSDVFSFGTILYEMLTGERPFRGATAADTTSAILREDAPELLGEAIPPALDRLVHHCLEKSPSERFQSAHDLAFNLEAISGLSGTRPAQVAPRKPAMPGWLSAVAASLLLLAVAALLLPRVLGMRNTSRPVMRLSLDVPVGLRLDFNSRPEISPDGSMVVFAVADSSGAETLWLQRLDSLTPRKLPGTTGGADPFWSPDGRSIAFFADAKLKRLPIAGGPIQVLCDAGSPRGGTWSRNDVIVFARGASGGLFRVDAGGGNPEPVTAPDSGRGETAHRYPCFLPDGEHFLFLAVPARNGMHDIFVGSLGSSRRKLVLRATDAPRYAAPGYLIYSRGDLLTAQRFDAGRVETKGEPITIAEAPSTSNIVGSPTASASNVDVVTYRLETISNTELGWYNGRGEILSRIATPPGQYVAPRLSPDGTRVVLAARDGSTSDVWLIELGSGAATRLTSDSGSESPQWSPDGTRILYNSDRLGGSALFLKSLRGGGDELLYKSPKPWITIWDWSRDGRYVAIREIDTATGFDLWILPTFGDRKPFPYLNTRFEEQSAAFAPGGHWIAYMSDESGQREIYVQSFPTPGDKRRISVDGGLFPNWSPDGKTLFYLHPGGRVVSVAIRADGTTLDIGTPRTVFTWPAEKLARIRGADIAADGRILIAMQPSESSPRTPALIVNWPELMKRKEP